MSLIEYSQTDGVARITLNRPPVNVLTSAMLEEFTGVLDEASEARVVVLAARGKAFCAGVDVGEHLPERVAPMLDRFHGACRALLALNAPTVAAVQGPALGGGCELVMLCDFAIAARSATFGQPEIKLASFPPVAAAALGRVAGLKRALSLILLGDVVSADAAQAAGLVTTVADDAELEGAVEGLVGRLARLSGPALRAAKRAVLQDFRHSFTQTLREAERLYLEELIDSADAREGITAFLERRAPVWKHR